MLHISNEQLESILTYEQFIPALRQAFCADIVAPMRHHHDYKNPKEGIDSTLLLMPAWEESQYLGIKMVNISPNNSRYNLPSIQGMYILMDAQKGTPLAWMDAKILTSIRTAAASALAASYLSRRESSSMLMIGTGALATKLVAAHASIRPIKTVYIWGRNHQKAIALAKTLSDKDYTVKAVSNIETVIQKVDIISTATLSPTPLVFGENLVEGQHIDLVGAFKPTTREADDEVMRRSRIFVDTMDGATKEAGDIMIPIQNGVIQKSDIVADLFDLCQKDIFARQTDTEITVFKSVGHALEDLAAAKMVYESIIQ